MAGGGSMVRDLRVGESLHIEVLPSKAATLDSRKITITLREKDGRRARLVVKADPDEVLIDRRVAVTP